MYALTNCTIYTNDSVLTEHCVIVDGEYIHDLVTLASCPADIEKIDLAGASLTAGFIDLQLNGCGGVLFNTNISVKTLEIMQETNERFGCTSYLPTLITATDNAMKSAIETMTEYLAKHSNQALGLHLEGPYLSTAKKGIHSIDLIRRSEQAMIDHISNNSAVISKVTLAPENTDPVHIEQLVAADVLVSVGHSNATYTECMQGFDAGARFATHLFNAMTSITGRDPGVVGAIYDHQDVYAGIIVDGHHVDYANVRMSHRLMGEKLVLVTDAVAPAGANIESFDFVGTEVFYRDGKCVGADGTLGGSALTMIEAVENTVKHVGLPLDETLRMANLYPAKAIGVEDKLGSIAKGKVANLTAFDADFTVIKTIVNGQVKSF
ncbi:N-acetylglucosamine-6-phosphate deacetylase [Moritella sp. F3]|uniref:N-acetylglucosamine-6-phosphate deacetylase n=1 Tax=Moritella sp. F3 TaxID=2718882 RepID=UPI0018E19EB8|nr:N-acetylglucosamine-6-phosphate deacetylase [Moritella sp. F3]GIC75382.1 N-acetylglucosamine-6-phosphate deacetylase [Moritella sp. F1]GIC80527.1 N-acetylglucosamine-6-phosphate deacetylase [Moritella sp. F3]